MTWLSHWEAGVPLRTEMGWRKLSGRCRRFHRAELGAAMVEFALVGGVFVAMLLGIFEFGLAVWQKNSAAADAREGARYAMVHGSSSGRIATPDSVRNFVKSRTSLDISGPDSIRVYTTWSPNKTPGSIVSVSVAHRVQRRGPFIPTHTDSLTSKVVIVF